MEQSAGGPHNSFQPIIQMGIAIQTRSLQVPLLSLLGTGSQAEPRLAFISHFRGQPSFSSVVSAALREKEQAFPKTTRQQSASGVIMAGMTAVSPEQDRQKGLD